VYFLCWWVFACNIAHQRSSQGRRPQGRKEAGRRPEGKQQKTREFALFGNLLEEIAHPDVRK
jgi:hypothetical protein